MNTCNQCKKAHKRPQDLLSHYTKTNHMSTIFDLSTQANSEFDDEIDFTAPIEDIFEEPVYVTRIRVRRPVTEIILPVSQIEDIQAPLTTIDSKHSYILKVANKLTTYYDKFRSICQLLNIDAKYERIPIGSYNKSARLYYNKAISNQYLPFVLEIDFDSFYPYTFIVNDHNVYPETLVRLFRALYATRMHYNSINDVAAESSIKSLQCMLAGCLGSSKDNSKGIQDFRSHSMMMLQTRTEIDKLREFVEQQSGLEVYSVQTDAVFINCKTQENVDKVIALMANFKTQYKYKFKQHTKLYHFTNENTYLSVVDNQACMKGFIGKKVVNGKQIKQYFEPYALRFMNQDQEALFEALSNIDKIPDIDCQPLLQSIGQVAKDIPVLGNKLSQMLHLRVESLKTNKDKSYTLRKHHWIKSDYFEQWLTMQDLSNTAIHEITSQDECWFAIDIDHLPATDNTILLIQLLKINNYICKDSRVKTLYETKSIRYRHAERKIDNDTYSVHLIFNIKLPLATQRRIAQEMNEHIQIEADCQIYGIGKSLRLPGCIKITKDVIEDKVLIIEDNATIKDFLYSIQQRPFAADTQPFYHYWINQTATAINHTTRFDYTDAKDQITTTLQTQFGLELESIKIKDKRTVYLKVKDNASDCVVCKRQHSYIVNRTDKLSIYGSKGAYQLQCGRANKRTPIMPAILLESIKLLSIEQTSFINHQSLTNGARQVELINRQFIIPKGSKYVIPLGTCLCIKSDMGTGKSEIVQSQQDQHKRVLLVSTRKVFTLAMQKRFNIADEQIYTNSNGLTQTSICQLESLGKATDQQWDVVVLDEIQSILQQITSTNTNVQTSKLSALLLDILRRADRVLVLDAQLEQSTIDWLISTLSKYTVKVIENKYQAFKGNKLTVVRKQRECDIYNNIIEQVVQRYNSKQKTWVIVSSVTDMQAALKCIIKRCPDIKLKVFCGLGEDPNIDNQYNGKQSRMHKTENKAFFSDINKFKDLDVVIHSAAVTSGLDVTGCGFNYVIGCIKTGQFSPQQLLQAIHRSRDVKEVLLFSQSLVIPSKVSKSYIQTLTHNSHTITGEGLDTNQIQALIQLSNQYKNDLNNLGLHYVTEQCKQMGYIVQDLIEYQKPSNKDYARADNDKATKLKWLEFQYMETMNSIVPHRYKERLDNKFEELVRQSQQLAHQQITGQLGTRGKFMIDNASLTGIHEDMQQMVDLAKYTYMLGNKDLMERAPETWNQYLTDIYRGNWMKTMKLLLELGSTAFKTLIQNVSDCKHHRIALEAILQIDGQKERNKAIISWGLEDAKHVSRISKVIDYIELHKLNIKTLIEVRQFAESRQDFPNNCYKLLGIHQDDQRCQVSVDGKVQNRKLLILVQSNDSESLEISVLKSKSQVVQLIELETKQQIVDSDESDE